MVNGRCGSLINADTAEALNLIKFTKKITTKESIIQEFGSVFRGIGKMKGVQVKLHIDETVQPVVQQYRRVPIPMREKVEEELNRLERAGVIEKVYGPTEWVSPLVLQTKKDSHEIRICVDMRLPIKLLNVQGT